MTATFIRLGTGAYGVRVRGGDVRPGDAVRVDHEGASSIVTIAEVVGTEPNGAVIASTVEGNAGVSVTRRRIRHRLSIPSARCTNRARCTAIHKAERTGKLCLACVSNLDRIESSN